MTGTIPSRESDASAGFVRARLQEALTSDARAREEFADAGCAVNFVIDHWRGVSSDVVRLSDGGEVSLTHAPENGEAKVWLSTEQAHRFCDGRLPLGPAILEGFITAEGPLRTYLGVDPVIQGALRETAERPSAPNSRPLIAAPKVDGASVPQELLAIETREVHKAFGDHRVLRGASLKIPEGTLSVVLGPSGTGKSVLIKHIIGALKPDQGDVLVRGRNLVGMGARDLQSLRREVGVMYQDGALFSSMNVYDNVAFSLREHTDITESEIREIVLERLQEVGLESAKDRFPAQLSGGMRKRAGLARAVVLEPRVLLCDEPDSGLDPVRTALIGDLLLARHAEYGGTIMVVTHNISLARMLAQHASLMWQGEVVAAGMAETFFERDDPFLRQFLDGAVDGPLGMD